MRFVKSIFMFLFVVIFLSAVSVSWAAPAANIRVIPVDGVHTGEPIVTSTPAEIQIFSTSHTPIENVWLILVINEDTFNHLNTITADGTTFGRGDFAAATESFIPPEDPSGSYPGCKKGDQYQVNAAKDKLGVPSTEGIYYAYKAFSLDPITTSIQTFTLTTNAPGVTHLKVLVLANGYYEPLDNPHSEGKLNEKTPWSGSTFVVPELATFLLISAFAAAFGAYRISHKYKPPSIFPPR